MTGAGEEKRNYVFREKNSLREREKKVKSEGQRIDGSSEKKFNWTSGLIISQLQVWDKRQT